MAEMPLSDQKSRPELQRILQNLNDPSKELDEKLYLADLFAWPNDGVGKLAAEKATKNC